MKLTVLTTRLFGEPGSGGEICTARLLQGLEMLIKEFGYHIAYKRWNDTFTAVPFKPK